MLLDHEDSTGGAVRPSLRRVTLMPYKAARGTLRLAWERQSSSDTGWFGHIIFGIVNMQFRSLLLLGFGISLAVNVQAFAAPPVPASPAPEASAVVQVATKAEEEALKKKKKAAADAKAKSKTTTAKGKTDKTKQVATSKTDKAKADKAAADKKKLLAKAKADKDKLAAAAKAKADEKAKLAAKAKAEKDKQFAKAKAEKDKQLAAAKLEREKKLAAAKVEKEKLAAAAKIEREKKLAAAKVERDKLMAERAKAAEARKILLAQQAEERRIAREKAAEERRIAQAQAAEQRRLAAEAKVKAAEEKRLAKLRAEEERRQQIAAAAEAARQAEIARLVAMEVVQTGNNSELRSEAQEAPKPVGLFAGLFGGQQVQKQSMLPETRALDAALELREAKKKFEVPPQYEPQVVQFSGYPRGTIVIDTASHYLYLMEGASKARRYAIAVGKEGLQYKGMVKVGDKQEWPRWIPTKEMQLRDPAKYGQYAEGMPGGGQNPLGARAIYLYQNGKDTHLRIHGTIAPETIGTDSSNGCFRMINEHVMDLYRRVPVGTEVVVL
jgi:lipoprotein-anchoring transpeptidase ErfK/SrfK